MASYPHTKFWELSSRADRTVLLNVDNIPSCLWKSDVFQHTWLMVPIIGA